MTSDIRSRPEWLFGDDVQQMLAEYFRSQRVYVVPSYDYAGPDGDRAPMLATNGDKLILPDLDVAANGVRAWVEIKAKDHAWRHNKCRRDEHGVDLRQFRHYQRVERETGTPVWLCVYERNTGAVLVTRIGALTESDAHPGQMVKGGFDEGPVLNVSRDAFTKVAQIHCVGGGIGYQLSLEPDLVLPFVQRT